MCGDDSEFRTIRRVIDMMRALELLAAAAGQHHGLSADPCSDVAGVARKSLVDRALSLAGVSPDTCETLGAGHLRELHARGALPIPLTLGAVVVLDAAQRAEHNGHADGQVLDHAVCVADRFVDLMPYSAFDRGRRADR